MSFPSIQAPLHFAGVYSKMPLTRLFTRIYTESPDGRKQTLYVTGEQRREIIRRTRMALPGFKVRRSVNAYLQTIIHDVRKSFWRP